jgi:hypothetical protein
MVMLNWLCLFETQLQGTSALGWFILLTNCIPAGYILCSASSTTDTMMVTQSLLFRFIANNIQLIQKKDKLKRK